MNDHHFLGATSVAFLEVVLEGAQELCVLLRAFLWMGKANVHVALADVGQVVECNGTCLV